MNVRTAESPRDDRIFRATRWVAAFIVPFLVVAFVMLYFFPGDTERLFAWTIKPPMTPMLMGAGYIAGSYFFLRVFLGTAWHHVTRGFLPVASFASTMSVATILHWDRFNHAHPSFYVWVALYAITPFLVIGTWLRNRSTDPGTPDRIDAVVPRPARVSLGIAGVLLILVAIFLFLEPDLMISIWPWKLTQLTARILAGWFALPAVLGLSLAFEPRWSAAKVPIESQALGIALILIGALRDWSDFAIANPISWVFTLGLLALLLFLITLYASMERRLARVV